MNKRSENHRNQEDNLTGSSALFTFLPNKIIKPTMQREEPHCQCQPQFLLFDSWCYFVFVLQFIFFSETFMELRVQRCGLCCTQGTRLATAVPLALWTQHLFPCSLIIFTIIYWLFLSAVADSLSKNSSVNNSAVLPSHKAALFCNYQAVLSWFCILITVPKIIHSFFIN